MISTALSSVLGRNGSSSSPTATTSCFHGGSAGLAGGIGRCRGGASRLDSLGPGRNGGKLSVRRPRDGQGRAFYGKGEIRALSDSERVRIDLALSSSILGLSVTDNWGTLTPAVFLDHLLRTLARGIEAGVGGAGLYLMWRMSDYLQVRVVPHRRTQITALWDLQRPLQLSLRTGFQFLYHSEYDEVLSHDTGRFTFH